MEQTIPTPNPPVIRHGLPLALAIAVIAYFYHGPIFFYSDDLVYIHIAKSYLDGTFQLINHHFYHRFTITLPTAALFAMFGANPYTATLLSLLATLFTLFLVHRIALQLHGPRAALLASLLTACNPFLMVQSRALLPDLLLSTLGLLAVWILLSARAHPTRDRQVWAGIVFAILFFIAVLAKISAIHLLPYAALLFLYDMSQRRHLTLWLSCSTSGIILALLFFGSYALLAGDPLLPIHAVDRHNAGPENYIDKSRQELIIRLVMEPIWLFLKNPGILASVLGVVPLLFAPRSVLTRPMLLPILGYVAALYAFFWLGSSSFSHYNPLPPVPRYLTCIIPPLSILGGILLASPLSRLAAITPLALAALAALLMDSTSHRLQILLAALPFALTLIPPSSTQHRLLPLLPIFLVPLVASLMGNLSVQPLQTAQMKFFSRIQSQLPLYSALYADEQTCNIFPLFTHFQGPNHFPCIKSWNGDPKQVLSHDKPALIWFNTTGMPREKNTSSSAATEVTFRAMTQNLPDWGVPPPKPPGVENLREKGSFSGTAIQIPVNWTLYGREPLPGGEILIFIQNPTGVP